MDDNNSTVALVFTGLFTPNNQPIYQQIDLKNYIGNESTVTEKIAVEVNKNDITEDA